MTRKNRVADEFLIVSAESQCFVHNRMDDLWRRIKQGSIPPLWAADKLQKISEMECGEMTKIIESQIVQKIRAGFHKALGVSEVDYRKSLLKFIEFKRINGSFTQKPLLIDPRISRSLKCRLVNVPIGTFVPNSWDEDLKVHKREKPYFIWFDVLPKTEIPHGEREKVMKLLLIDEVPEFVLHYRNVFGMGKDTFLFNIPQGTWLFYFDSTGYSHFEFTTETFSEDFPPNILVAGAERM